MGFFSVNSPDCITGHATPFAVLEFDQATVQGAARQDAARPLVHRCALFVILPCVVIGVCDAHDFNGRSPPGRAVVSAQRFA